MIKIVLISFFMMLSLQAGLVNAIAFIINDDAVTLVDIDNKMQEKKISRDQAIKDLIDEALYNQELKKFHIKVDSFDIDRYMEQLASRNNMNLYAFENALKQQQDLKKFKAQVKQQLKHQKLVQAIASNKLTQVTDEDMKIYYENNPLEFQLANKVDVIHYSSTDKQALELTKNNPMMQQNGVYVQNATIELANVSSQMKYILTQTPIQEYSAIFAEDRAYHMFFVSDKKDVKTVDFEKVKNNIFNHMMKTREDEFLKNYFEALKISADIKFLR